MTGINRSTGKLMAESEHIRQSIADILLTPLGSRVMRRDYGSDLPFLLDQPFNGTTQQLCIAAASDALQRWETRLQLSRVAFVQGTGGSSQILQIEGTLVNSDQAYSTEVQVSLGGYSA